MMALLLHELEKAILSAEEADCHPEGAKEMGVEGSIVIGVKEGTN